MRARAHMPAGKRETPAKGSTIEWPTLGLIILTYSVWALCVRHAADHPVFALPVLTLTLTLFASLQHEIIHGHPTPWPWLNRLLLFPALGLFYPFLRFERLHLEHHRDSRLTDPYDDPESFYLAQREWAVLPGPVRLVLAFNNTLLGRLIVGPAIALGIFYTQEARALMRGNLHVAGAWAWHGVALTLAIWLIAQTGPVSPWVYAACAYGAMSGLMLRTFAEHQAHESTRARSVIIESRGLPALLFLNNNLHAVHHAAPDVPWYALPDLYRARRNRFLRLNRGYAFPGYWAVFKAHALKAKEPVPHPFVIGVRDRGRDAPPQGVAVRRKRVRV